MQVSGHGSASETHSGALSCALVVLRVQLDCLHQVRKCDSEL